MSKRLKLWQQVYSYLLSTEGIFCYEEVGAIFGRPGKAIGPCMERIGRFDHPITNRVVYKKDLKKFRK